MGLASSLIFPLDAIVQPSNLKTMSKNRTATRMLSIRVTEDWIERLEAWIDAQEIKPSKTAVITAAVDRFIRVDPIKVLS